MLLHHADQGAVQPEVQRPGPALRSRPGRAAHRGQQHQRRGAGGGDDHRGAPQHALRRLAHPVRAGLRGAGRGPLPGRPLPRRGVGGSDHPPAGIGPGGRAVRDGEQRRGVRRLAGPGPGRHHGDRGRAPAGSALAAHAGRRAAVRPLPRVRPGHGSRGGRGSATGPPGHPGQRRAQVNPELLRLARRDDWAARKAPTRPAGAAGGRSASGRRAGRRSSTGWTAPGCSRRSPSSSAGRVARPRSASAWTPGSGSPRRTRPP